MAILHENHHKQLPVWSNNLYGNYQSACFEISFSHKSEDCPLVAFKNSRDGRIVIFCRIPGSVNRRLISGQFRIRIWIFDVTLPLVYTYKNYSKSRPMLYFPVIFNLQ